MSTSRLLKNARNACFQQNLLVRSVGIRIADALKNMLRIVFQRPARLLTALAVLGGAIAQADDTAPPDSRPKPDLRAGRLLFESRCAVCHGRHAHGDGPAARQMDPRPRDLTRGEYILRSTPSGSLPTDDDLFATLTRGLPGTAMVGWAGLPSLDRWQLVYYLRSISSRFATETPEPPVAIPVPPPASAQKIALGRAVWERMKCAQCHGADGRGDGPAARTLSDPRGRRVYAFDLTRSWKLKGGGAPEDLYRTLHTGLDGTPMPSYDAALQPDEAWALVYFVRSLALDVPLPYSTH